jgi:hypothetical protein
VGFLNAEAEAEAEAPNNLIFWLYGPEVSPFKLNALWACSNSLRLHISHDLLYYIMKEKSFSLNYLYLLQI